MNWGTGQGALASRLAPDGRSLIVLSDGLTPHSVRAKQIDLVTGAANYLADIPFNAARDTLGAFFFSHDGRYAVFQPGADEEIVLADLNTGKVTHTGVKSPLLYRVNEARTTGEFLLETGDGLFSVRPGEKPSLLKERGPRTDVTAPDWWVGAVSSRGDILLATTTEPPTYDWLSRQGQSPTRTTLPSNLRMVKPAAIDPVFVCRTDGTDEQLLLLPLDAPEGRVLLRGRYTIGDFAVDGAGNTVVAVAEPEGAGDQLYIYRRGVATLALPLHSGRATGLQLSDDGQRLFFFLDYGSDDGAAPQYLVLLDLGAMFGAGTP